MGKRFLLVDDEASIRMTLRRLLAAMGCEVEIAASREEAFKLLQDNDHDVVLCDLYLPDGSGAEIFAEHSRLGRTSSFVMMTGYNDPQMNAIMGANGDMPLLIKPFGIDQLMTVL